MSQDWVPTVARRAVLALMVVASSSAPAEMTERERVQSHLKLVESLLRGADVGPLDPVRLQHRLASLDDLHRYWEAGEFPENLDDPGHRHPVFIDDRGVPCAVGYLLIASGSAELALRLAGSQNALYLEQMEDSELAGWVEASGFTLDELRLIQPSYGYRPRYQDPILEAANLADLDKVHELLRQSGLPPGSEEYRRKVTDTLRAAATGPIFNPQARDQSRPHSQIRTREAAEREGGLELMSFLLGAGADPSDTSEGRPTILYEAVDPEVAALLVPAGGALTDAEGLLRAIAADADAEIDCLLSLAPQFSAKHTGGRLRSQPSKVVEGRETYRSQSAFKPALDYDLPGVVDELLKRGFEATDVTDWDAAVRYYLDRTFPNPYMRKPVPMDGVTMQKALQRLLEKSPGLHANPLNRPLTVSAAPAVGAAPAIDPDLRQRLRDTLQRNRAQCAQARVCQSAFVQYLLGGSVEGSAFLASLGAKLGDDDLRILPRYLGGLQPQGQPLDAQQWRVVKLLVENKAEVNTYMGDTVPLSFAVLTGDATLARYLLAHGAKPEAGRAICGLGHHTHCRCTALAIAVAKDDLTLIRLLLTHGADPYAKYFDPDKSCTDRTFVKWDTTAKSIEGMAMSREAHRLLFGRGHR